MFRRSPSPANSQASARSSFSRRLRHPFGRHLRPEDAGAAPTTEHSADQPTQSQSRSHFQSIFHRKKSGSSVNENKSTDARIQQTVEYIERQIQSTHHAEYTRLGEEGLLNTDKGKGPLSEEEAGSTVTGRISTEWLSRDPIRKTLLGNLFPPDHREFQEYMKGSEAE